MNWFDAMFACNRLNTIGWNGYTTGWRLPTQKELMEAYVHGFRSVEGPNWNSEPFNIYPRLSATTSSTNTAFAFAVGLSFGDSTMSTSKTSPATFVCVR